ncbi:hypothetical protein NC653_032188 [Populus alba x Populus x berolinensis]|uniref:Uncharacterized protein n=1 Tax=Populus alba x Populus x berolinensis TaxID=444605 RepID=A0AAD6PXR8_9ROSI|nr:hypothetical protein NC653_032188 [Populus alba x Populus x berolinensis]
MLCFEEKWQRERGSDLGLFTVSDIIFGFSPYSLTEYNCNPFCLCLLYASTRELRCMFPGTKEAVELLRRSHQHARFWWQSRKSGHVWSLMLKTKRSISTTQIYFKWKHSMEKSWRAVRDRKSFFSKKPGGSKRGGNKRATLADEDGKIKGPVWEEQSRKEETSCFLRC